MKTSTSAALIGLAAIQQVAAFPSYGLESFEKRDVSEGLGKRVAAPIQGTGFLPASPPPFNATLQYVSNMGANAFVAPASTDARGPCPGLNAMANHGYLPHNGVATIQQFMDGTETAFGMARDLSGFLATYGAYTDGDGTGWSIAGVPKAGISGSHNNYETDSSPLKSDLNQYGYNGKLIMEQFYELYNMQSDAATANYNLEVLRTFRGTRFQESISKNPYFYYAPFTGILVSQAAFTFVYRFMSNKSAEYPEGLLNKATLKSFMSITGPENNLTWTYGYEKFPDNWYKRNPSDEYSIPYFLSDVGAFASTQPEILEVGCNLGAINTYNGVSPAVLSGGAYSASDVAANPGCYGLAAISASGYTSKLGLSASSLQGLNNLMAPLLKEGNCKAFANGGNFTSLSLCPGMTMYGGPTGPVAPGAVQS